jgi:hypothetical protein
MDIITSGLGLQIVSCLLWKNACRVSRVLHSSNCTECRSHQVAAPRQPHVPNSHSRENPHHRELPSFRIPLTV